MVPCLNVIGVVFRGRITATGIYVCTGKVVVTGVALPATNSGPVSGSMTGVVSSSAARFLLVVLLCTKKFWLRGWGLT